MTSPGRSPVGGAASRPLPPTGDGFSSPAGRATDIESVDQGVSTGPVQSAMVAVTPGADKPAGDDTACPGCTPDVVARHDTRCHFRGDIGLGQRCDCTGDDYAVIHSEWCRYRPGGGAFANWPRPVAETPGEVLSSFDFDDPYGRPLLADVADEALS